MQAKKIRKLPADLQAINDRTTKVVPCEIEQGRWYQMKVVLKDDVPAVYLDGKKSGSYQSPGFGHPRKDMYRFIMQGEIHLDDMKVVVLD